MDIRWFGPDDVATLDDYVVVQNDLRAADSAWMNPLTRHEAQGAFRHGWDGEPAFPCVGYADGVPVATGEYSVSEYDNLHLAWAEVGVHPDHRRRGHGSELLGALGDRARAAGRTSLGINGWESSAARGFAAAHGLVAKSIAVNRRQLLADLDRAALDDLAVAAAPHATAYDLVRLVPPTPAAELGAMAAMTAAINDAPTDDLDYEDESFSPERIAAYEAAQAGRGLALHRVVARHRQTGDLAGQSVVVVDLERPHLAEQHDTSVVAAHRGHRLGLLLKLDMLRWLHGEWPGLAEIDTWNAASNDFMIGVNEALAYRVMGTEVTFQRDL